MIDSVRAAFAALLIITASCSKPDRVDSRVAHTWGNDALTLDSCAKLDATATPQHRVLEPGETLPPPHPGSWTLTKRVAADGFELVVPAAADLRHGREAGSYLVSELPGCRYGCGIGITFIRDSSDRSLDQYVAALRADTTNGETAGMDVPGPPRRIRFPHADGLIMDDPCGDCAAVRVLVKRDRMIAQLGYSLDDREGYQPDLMCHLARVASSFDWIGLPPR